MTTARSDNRGRPWVINHFKGDVAMNAAICRGIMPSVAINGK